MTALAGNQNPRLASSMAKPGTPEFLAGASLDALAPLDAILCTEELAGRPVRPPDYETESRAMALLVQALADSPRTILQTLTDNILTQFKVGSAGVSLLSKDEKYFVWPAIAGAWQSHISGDAPRDFSPCGDVLDQDAPLLFRRFERRYVYLQQASPPAEECLLIPFYVKGKAVGTIWAIAHDDRRKFDAEDLRQLQALGRFASAAYQSVEGLDTALTQMGDALRSRQALEKANAELLESRKRYRMLFESLDEGFCVIERVEGIAGEPADFRFVEANPAFAVQSGVSAVVGKTLRQLFGDESREWIEIYDAVCSSGKPIRFEREFVSQRRVLELYAFQVADKTPYRVAINFQDITERNRAQKLLSQNRDTFLDLIEKAPLGLCVVDAQLCLLQVSATAQKWFGNIRPLVGRNFEEVVRLIWAEPSVSRGLERFRHTLETGESFAAPNVTQQRHDFPNAESYAWNIERITMPDGKFAVVCYFYDITERIGAEIALRESQRFLRSSLDALSGHIAVLDKSGTILEINEGWTRFALENQGSWDHIGIGVNYFEHCKRSILHGGDTPAYVTGINDVIAGRRTRFEMEYPCHSPTEKRWFVMRVTRFQDPGPVRIVIVHDNCTERKLAEEASRESEVRYRNLFNSIDEGFCIIDMIFDDHEEPVDCRFLEVNPAFEKQSGLPDVKGKQIREFIPDLEQHWFEFYGQVALTGTPARVVRYIKSLDSWFDIYAARLGAPENRQVAIIFNNITQRVKSDNALRHSEERFRALFDRGPIAMYSCDASGTIQEYNRNAVLLWGREPVRGNPNERFCGAFKLLFPDGSPMPHAHSPIAAVLRGEPPIEHGVEVLIERADGSRITIIANIVPLKNDRGEITGAINCMYDITERSRLQCKTVEQAQKLVELDRRKDEFLAMLSHELRNPLAPLSNAVQLLRLHKNDDPVQQQAHGIIERQVGQLKHLVDDLLEVSRITSGSVRLRQDQISLSDVVERAVETAQPLIRQHRHELAVNLPRQEIFLHADAARLEQVLVNLLTNAAKYTDDGGRIWLSVEQEGDAGGAVAVVRVRDSGIGIDAELLPRIFELFTQAERSLDRSEGGLGIGLSLVRRLVELHGGTVNAYSTPGQGSEFVVRLPVMPTALSPSPAHRAAPPSAQSRKVLVVDDNVDAVQSLANLLKLFGHEVQIAYDGQSGLEAAQATRPDVVLLDIGLPGLTGFEVAEQIRQQPALDGTVLVALTGYGRDTDRQLSQDAGFDHHLVKPADFAAVQTILASIKVQSL